MKTRHKAVKDKAVKGLVGSVACILLTQSALTQGAMAAYTPKKGSSERTAIMNSLRRVLGDGRHKAIISPYHFRVESGWAFMMGDFSYSDGSKPGGIFAEGSGTNFTAMLHRENGKWRVKRRVYNGDVQTPEFIAAFPKAPRSIFKTP